MGQGFVDFGGSILRSDLRFEVGTERSSLYLFIDNVTNEDDVTTPSDDQGLFAAFGAQFDGLLGTRLRPRTIGAGLRMKF
ncbi:MAG: hypothetical protein EP347_03845 [Alphaproteobacteria bacterium]|nr:MAG: hypothetical protein EP347_03845 [Alphaproteobacteria bacterium]